MLAGASISRRSVLRVGGAGLFGLSFPRLLAAAEKPAAQHKATARSVIFLHQWGGPGQHETFDPKPDAPDIVRGWYGATKTKIPGVIFGERIPKLAAMADKFTVIRCLQHSMKNHNSAGYYSLTGVAPAIVLYLWALRDFGLTGWLAAFLFFGCGALRLARFNVLAQQPHPS